MKKLTHEGFTLTELITAVAIISILAAISLPIYQIYTNKTRVASCHNEATAYVREHGININIDIGSLNLSIYNPSSCLSAENTNPVNSTELTNNAIFIARDTSATEITCSWLTLVCKRS